MPTKSGPTHGKKRRKARQKLREHYAKVREDAQLAGVIPTAPEGALRSEVVDPRLQGCQQLPAIVRDALRENWSTPNEAKPGIVGSLLEPFFSQDVVLDKDGNQVKVPPNRAMLIELAKTLKMLDQTQFERDNPEQAAKAKGGSTTSTVVSVGNTIAATGFMRDALSSPDVRAILDQLTNLDEQRPNIEVARNDQVDAAIGIAGALSNGRHAGEVEASRALEDHQSGTGRSVDDPEQPHGNNGSFSTR